MMIAGFKMKVGKLNRSERSDVCHLVTQTFGSATVLSTEFIHHNDKEELCANAVSYNRRTQVMSFYFPEPRHEMTFSEDFISSANGIVQGKSNLEIIPYRSDLWNRILFTLRRFFI